MCADHYGINISPFGVCNTLPYRSPAGFKEDGRISKSQYFHNGGSTSRSRNEYGVMRIQRVISKKFRNSGEVLLHVAVPQI